MDPFLQAAIAEARLGLSEGGLPIGSVLVSDGKIIARGHNRRVQQGDPMAHAEIDCLRNAGRQRSYREMTLYSTLMPCYLCTGAVLQFGIRSVVVGESTTFPGGDCRWGRSPELLRAAGVHLIDLQDPTCIQLMRDFIAANPALWNEDIGVD
jgi:cytosine/creatinine deaminase